MAESERPASATPPPDEAAPAAAPRLDNEALRQLFFSDPHFRQSDGLDVGLADEFEIGSSPLARQRKIMQARAMGMLDDEMIEQEPPPADDPAGR